jgi:very-short-patch-repair endonuclease
MGMHFADVLDINLAKTESPIESAFLRCVSPLLRDDVAVVPQKGITSPWGVFRLDFVLERGALRVCVECDGAEFHEDGRDEWRDVMCISAGYVSDVFRFRGKDLYARPDDCVGGLAVELPELFSERGLHIALRRASEDVEPQIRRLLGIPQTAVRHAQYRNAPGCLSYWHRSAKSVARDPFCSMVAKYLDDHRGMSLQAVNDQWHVEHPW